MQDFQSQIWKHPCTPHPHPTYPTDITNVTEQCWTDRYNELYQIDNDNDDKN